MIFKTVVWISMILSVFITGAQSTDGTKPNVLLIMVDDMNDWVGAFGGNPQAITPNIDELAQRGTVFQNAYCSAPLCNPSRTSMLTGLLPSTTEVYGNTKIFRENPEFKDVITLPQYFKQNGYKTAAAGKVFHSPRGNGKKPKPGSDPGSFEEERSGGLGVPFPEERFKNGLDFDGAGILGHIKKAFDWQAIPTEDEKTNDWQSADWAAEYLNKDHDKPFFLACGIFRPHLPWYAPTKYFDMYDEQEINLPNVLASDLDDVGKFASRMVNSKLHSEIVRTGNWRSAMVGYLASLTFADACVGHLLDNLKKSAYNENTIVVLMGDHGWHLGEKEHWAKQTLWEESAKTPLIIYDPRNKVPKVSTRIVSLIDIYPTLVDLCELPEKNGLDGLSFKKLLNDPKAKWERSALTTKKAGNHSLRNENFRYIQYGNGEEELYDHTVDPMEWENLASKNEFSEVLVKFRVELKELLARAK